MDFIEGLSRSKGRDTVLVVVNRLSKYAHFLPLSYPFSVVQVAHFFFLRSYAYMEFLVVLFLIVTIFLSNFWSKMFRLLGSDLRCSSAYHLQTEVVNCYVETYLPCFSTDKPSRWLEWLAWAKYNYNTSFHTAAAMTPFQVVYGRDPSLVIRFEWGSTAN